MLNLADYEIAQKQGNKNKQNEKNELNQESAEVKDIMDKKKKRKAQQKLEVHIAPTPLSRYRNCWILLLNRAFQHVRLDLLLT